MNDIDIKIIEKNLKKNHINIDIYLKNVPSTQSEAKERVMSLTQDCLFISHQQSAGRGRLDRRFISDVGGAYFSLVFSNRIFSMSNAIEINILAALSMVNFLIKYKIKADIKWPNDILINNKKVSGIIAEGVNTDKGDKFILGIGVNVNNAIDHSIASSATSLKNEGYKLSIEDVIGGIIVEFNKLIEKIKNEGLSTIINQYKKHCITINKRVKITDINTSYDAYAEDIDSRGFLIVLDGNRKRIVVSGDVIHCSIN